MILRTPQRKRKAESAAAESPSSDRHQQQQPLVIYESPQPLEASHQHHELDHLPASSSEQLICTYQCKQMVKAEFLDALSSAEKLASESSSKLEGLNENFAKCEAERKKFRDQFLYAEQELAAAKRREQVLQEQLLKEVDSSHEQLREKIQLCNEIEEKYQKEMNLRKNAESTAVAAEEKVHFLEEKLSSLSGSTEREKKRLQDELVQLKSESKFSVSKISIDLERMELRANNAEKESVRLTEQLEDIRKKFYECMEQKSEVENKLSSMMSHVTSSTDSDILVKNLREELRSYESEVHEARKLKSSHDNIEVLKEKILEEKGRRERAESEVLKFSEFQLKVTKLEDELSAWNSMIQEIPGLSCVNEIPLKIKALQKEVVDCMMKEGEAQSSLKQMEVDLDAAKLNQKNAETEAAMAKEQVQLSTSDVKRMELMLSSVTEERDGLKKIIDELRKQRSDEVGAESSGTVIQELEAAVAIKENCIKELKGNICELKEVNARQNNEIKLLNDRHIDDARSIKLLERESDRLRSEIALLESKLGHGDFSSTSTKVLRMVNTLTVDNEAKQTIEALKSELQKTKEKLQAVEELKKQSGSGAVSLDDSYVSGKIIQLKEQIATLEKREERYKTVFADRISVFRRACCELFGYKIVMDDHQRSDGIPVTRFTLQSIYAQRDDEKLEFEYESGNTSILGNDYTSQSEISRQVDIFIRKLNSIPAFTANLTVESFNKRTLC